MSSRSAIPSPAQRTVRQYPSSSDFDDDDDDDDKWSDRHHHRRTRQPEEIITRMPAVPSPVVRESRPWSKSRRMPPPSLPRQSSSNAYLSPPEDPRYRPRTPPDPAFSDDLSDSTTTTTTATKRPPPSQVSSSGTLGDKAYRYKELGRSEFRLVRLLRRTKTDIKCEIVHASLVTPPTYVAVSYAWGDAGDTRKIKIDGVSVSVSASLHGALEALRQRNYDVLVWVDALCIDQANQEERSEQVRLMTNIYAQAESVAVWLGGEADDSVLGMRFLRELAETARMPNAIARFLSKAQKQELEAVASLFERDYWSRLWVVQEIFNAKTIQILCGTSSVEYSAFSRASAILGHHREILNSLFPAGQGRGQVALRSQFSVPQALVHQGPASFPDFRLFRDAHRDDNPNATILLDALCSCRRKFAADPRDKVFGILGVLPPRIREEFTPDYSLAPKEVYTDVVDYLLTTTSSLNVICEAVHFPLHSNAVTHSLPSFVPDWSHIPSTTSLAQQHLFSAGGNTRAEFRFLDDRRNKLEIDAVYLDTIGSYGVAVGTLCTLMDYLMAFLQWRALLLGTITADDSEDSEYSARIQQAFCRTLCLDQVPSPWDSSKDPRKWQRVVYHIFASFLRKRLPHLALDSALESHLHDREIEDEIDEMDDKMHRHFVQDHFGERMMGRRFCLTEKGLMGMGSGFMAMGDIVVVPLGCDLPILLRPEGKRGEYRFVGEIYVHGYMRGRAIEQVDRRDRRVAKYILH